MISTYGCLLVALLAKTAPEPLPGCIGHAVDFCAWSLVTLQAQGDLANGQESDALVGQLDVVRIAVEQLALES